MEVSESILSRHSCRAFKPDPVPEALTKGIPDLAKHSPSYMNSQPWKIAVVTWRKLMEPLSVFGRSTSGLLKQKIHEVVMTCPITINH
jgi:nitroreductase